MHGGPRFGVLWVNAAVSEVQRSVLESEKYGQQCQSWKVLENSQEDPNFIIDHKNPLYIYLQLVTLVLYNYKSYTHIIGKK
jgi:hypothetical protein